MSTTVPPARSEIVRVDSTGVRRATRSTSGRAAAIMARAVTRVSPGRQGSRRSRRRRRAAARRRRSCCARAARRRSSVAVRLVDVLERGDVGHVDAAADRVVERRAGRRGDDREVVEAAPRLRADVALDQRSGVRIDRRLAREEDQPAALDGVRVGAGRLGRADRGDRFAMMGHGKGNLHDMQRTALAMPRPRPYLLQHAENPVDWYPWGEEALSRARAEDKPILVSIGYAACHWCHVMERESFENPEIAALMNERFVCIKVDREERPDVDAIYMDAVQAMTGRGGWPLNAFLTPEGVPFYAGTYFPPEPRHGMPSWPQVVIGVANAFAEQRAEIEEAGKRILPRLAGAAALPPAEGDMDPAALDAAVDVLRRGYDQEHGGFTHGRAEVPGRVDDRVPAAPRRAADGAAHAARDGRRRHVRPDRRRLRALLGRRPLGHPALREDALRQRAARARVPARLPGVRRAVLRARVHRDARLGAARPAPGGGRLRVGARRRLRGRRGQVLRLDAGRDARRARRRRGAPRSRTSGSTGPPNFEGAWTPVRAASDPDGLPEIKARLRAAREAAGLAGARRQAPDAPGTR